MELYDSKFVHFEWDDELKGKKGFVALSIKALKEQVNNNPASIVSLAPSSNDEYPFAFDVQGTTVSYYNFAYYDPDYAAKKAFMEGQTIEAMRNDNDMLYDWFPVSKDTAAEGFNFNEFKVRLPEIKWHVVFNDEGTLGIAKSTNKHIYFTGNEEECVKWIDEHKDLANIMWAWEEGKALQFKNGAGDWKDVEGEPLFNGDEYRIKPTTMLYHVIIVCDTFVVESDETSTPKHEYYTGLSKDCDKWIEEHKHLLPIMIEWEQGKTIQFKNNQQVESVWIDTAIPMWEVTTEYRVKPEDIYEVGIEGEYPKFVMHNVTKTGHHIPTYVFFKGNRDECEEWCDKHRKFIDTMAAWQNGSKVEVKNYTDNWFPTEQPEWKVEFEYRVKPEDKYVPFDNLQELITKWEGMNPGCTNRPKCAMPMIWVKSNRNHCTYLITGYDEEDAKPVFIDDVWISLKDLFSYYRFINDSIIGKKDR